MTCHAGCAYPDIIKALGLDAKSGTRKIIATYDYRDASGALIHQKIKFEPKDFRQRWPDGKGRWLWKKPKDAPAVLYNLAKLLEAKAKGETAYVLEGEKDVDRAKTIGVVATSTVEGAAKEGQRPKWRTEYTEQLAGFRRVVLTPDNDPAGRAHMRNIAKQLQGKVADLRWLELPGLPEKGDLSDWLNQGHTREEFEALAEQAPPYRELKVTFTPAPGSPWRQIPENAESVREKFEPKSSQSSQSSQSITYKFPSHHKVITNPSQSHHHLITVEAPLLETEKGRGVTTIIDSKAAQLLAGALQGHLAFSRDTQLWHGFTGTHWQPFFSPAIAEELISRLVFAGTPNVGFESRYLNGLIGLLRRGLLPMPEPVENTLIPFANGLLNPVTRALTPITPENAPTWSLPYAYSPSADCPTIKAWLKKAVGNDADSVEFLRAWLAALLTGRADLQKFLHLIGPAGTGKGTFIRLAKALVGDANTVVTDLRSLEQNRFETAALYGKRLAAITDTSRYGGSVDVFKALTGQDPLRLERKHQQQTATFQFEGMTLLASNEAIQTSDLTGALERRRLTVRFDHVASDEERRLWDTQGGEAAVLHREIPGLVNWLLELNRADVTRLITQRPARVAAANLEALRASNPVADWMMDSLIPDPSAQTQVGIKIENRQSGVVCFEQADVWLYPNYLRWCQQHGREALSLTRFSGLILDVGKVLGKNLTKDRDRYGAHVKGLRLAREEDLSTCDDLTRPFG